MGLREKVKSKIITPEEMVKIIRNGEFQNPRAIAWAQRKMKRKK